jgi:DNA-binding CsgD family transcriptional regulator
MVGAVRSRERKHGPAGLRGQPLSDRETGVLRLVAEGMSNGEIAGRLYISSQTVKTHLERICTKLGVSGLVDMAHALGLHVVAEGVETADQLVELQRLGCDAVQGYLLARPARPESLQRFFTAETYPS